MRTILMAVMASATVGCANAAFVKGVNAGVETIGPEYEGYVRADARLDDASKALRLKTLAELRKLIAEMLK